MTVLSLLLFGNRLDVLVRSESAKGNGKENRPDAVIALIGDIIRGHVGVSLSQMEEESVQGIG
jgi:hypothetical protein